MENVNLLIDKPLKTKINNRDLIPRLFKKDLIKLYYLCKNKGIIMSQKTYKSKKYKIETKIIFYIMGYFVSFETNYLNEDLRGFNGASIYVTKNNIY